MKYGAVKVLALALVFLGNFGPQARAQNSLIATGSVWKYLDTGSNEGVAWRTLGFNDAGWSSGAAQLGFSSSPSENDETTFISRTNALGETIITFYFRHTFDVSNPSLYTNLLVRLRRDDGAIVYLNDVEIFRSNITNGPVDFLSLAFLAQDDGANFFANAIGSPTPLRTGPNVLAVEVHQNAITSTDISFDLELLANVIILPPEVVITSPASNAVSGSPTLVVAATASDSDGTISMVEFYRNGTFLDATMTGPFRATNFNLIPGSYTFIAVAIDSTGLSTTSAPVTVTILPWLVPSGANWRYLDDGSEQGSLWRQPVFNDGGWSNGVAQLGFGEGDEATFMRRFSDLTGTNAVTYYFRHAFNVANPSAISNLAVRLVRDDGAVVYLNGAEIFRSNMPTGAISASTFASQVAEDNLFRATRVTPSLLATGNNVIAVELHQVNLTSSDVSFDLELLPNIALRRPVAVITSPADNAGLLGPTNVTVTASVTDIDDAVASVAFFLDGAPAGLDVNEPYSALATNLLGNHTIYAVATDSTGLSSTSAPVNIGVALVTPFVSTGAVWKYLDTGPDQGTNWRTADFDDNAWLVGAAKFGTNDPGINTPIRIRSQIGAPVYTCYFRHFFTVTNSVTYTNLAFRVLRDDGCIAYLNGMEIFRMNMPTGIVTFNTPVANPMGGADETNYFTTNVVANLLHPGTNLLAVELHQATGTADAGFDLGLRGIAVPTLRPPNLSIQLTSTNILLQWPGTGYTLLSSPTITGTYSPIPSATSPYPVNPATGNRFYRLRSQ